MTISGRSGSESPVWDAKGNLIDPRVRTPVLGPVKWMHQVFLVVTWLGFIMSSHVHSDVLRMLAVVLCVAGIALNWLSWRMSRLGNLPISYKDREAFIQRVTAALDRAGFYPVSSNITGMGFGPRTAFRTWLMGSNPILIDFLSEGSAIISGPQQTLNRIKKSVQ